MSALTTLPFREITCVDFEYGALPGERPSPVCLVAHELKSGKRTRLWEDELQQQRTPPYPIDRDSLVVAYYASAEVACHLALGWDRPVNVLDLYTEFRNRTNGLPLPCGNGLVGALTYFGLDSLGAVEKHSMQMLALRGGPWTSEERQALLEYCESDVIALEKLLPCMLANLDLPRALLRGRYMGAAAFMEHIGIPIDVPAVTILRERWESIKDELICQVDAGYGVFKGRTFKRDRFAQYLVTRGIPWPRLESGALALDDDTFKTMSRTYPELAPLRELRVTLSEMKLEALAVGTDGRNRTMLSAFRAKTSRNQPSNTKFIFGPAKWLRGLIRPAPGWGLAYIDWEQQEFGIAAVLSRDPAMLAAYESGDPYLAFAEQAGAVPEGATKQTHGAVRGQFKECALGVQYGMGEESLALRIGQSVARARELLRLHRQTYKQFWKWSDSSLDYANLNGRLHTVFGWIIRLGTNPNMRSFRNFPMQSNGAEMLRLACCLATERGVRVCAPVHDAILIEAPLDKLDEAVAVAQRAMADASAMVLGGFRLRSEVNTICYPDRYQSEGAQRMWEIVWDIIENKTAEAALAMPASNIEVGIL